MDTFTVICKPQKNRYMKKIFLVLAVLFPFALFAQVNDMFYLPKKSVKPRSATKMVTTEVDEEEWGVADNGNTRDVDEYNRRGAYGKSVSSSDVSSVLSASQEYEEEYVDYEVDDYNYSTRIVRFHNPTTVVVSSPLYWDIYWRNCYDPWYDSYWDWSFHYGNIGFRYHSSWCWPSSCYSWHSHYVPHHHNHGLVYHPASVRKRIPVADRRTGVVSTRRPTVGAQGGNRRPVGQVVRDKNDNNRKPATVRGEGNRKPVGQAVRDKKDNNRKPVKTSTSQRSERKQESNVRRGSGSTYNRPSSTSVRRNSSSSGSRPAVNRGGTSRQGRR